MQWSRFLLDESTKQRLVTMAPCFRVCAELSKVPVGCPDVLLPATLLYLDIRRPGPCTGPGPYNGVHHIISTFYIETCLRSHFRNNSFWQGHTVTDRSLTWFCLLLWDGGKTSVSVAAGRIHRHRQPRDEGLLRLCGGVMVVMVACQQQSQYSDSAQTKPQNSTSHLRSNTGTPPRRIPPLQPAGEVLIMWRSSRYCGLLIYSDTRNVPPIGSCLDTG